MKDQKKKNPDFQKNHSEKEKKNLSDKKIQTFYQLLYQPAKKLLKKYQSKSYFSQSVTTAQMILALNTNEGMNDHTNFTKKIF